MSLQEYLDQLIGPSTNQKKIGAAHCLAPFTHDSRVMDALCEAAVSTNSHKVRETLIDVLKTNSAGAGMRFSDDALWSKDPVVRKWALVNLSLLGCSDAKQAVINGLNDPDASVRKAAAMNAGLYADKDVHNELERYFENHRFGLTLSFISEGFKVIGKRAPHPDDHTAASVTGKVRRPDPLPGGSS
jgi:hypothetical protein